MVAAISIRLANSADATGIAALSRIAIEHGLPWRWTPMRVRRAIADAASNVVVGCIDSAPVGFAIMKYGDDTAHLLLMAVRRDARRRGAGRAMLAWLEQVALAGGIARVHLEARHDNEDALAFYGRHGFVQMALSHGYYAPGIDAVVLERRLDRRV
jgi:[ribosomal protein S18]-alanine N-acetyltransferase